MTVRGETVATEDGRYRVRLKMREGINRFTVIARHSDRQTNRRPVRVDRRVPPPPAPVAEGCPRGQAPVGATGACAPYATTKVPCIYGDGLCTPEENQAEGDAEARCGPLDPTRFDENGNYVPLPGC